MLIALCGLVLLAAFTLMPLYWLAAGWPWMPLVVTFALIPLLDWAVGAARRDRPHGLQRLPSHLARWLPRAQLPLQAMLLVGAVQAAPHQGPADLLWLMLAVGTVTGGMGITVAHELGHRPGRLDRWLARLLLVSVAYGHFYVEHNRGHHARVATPEDPASAPRGMNVYRFILRSVTGGLVHAWRLEAMRLQAGGRAVWHLSNWVLGGSLLSLLIALAAWLAAGPAGVALWIGQAIGAFVLLEIVNYIEHYGLRRQRSGGRYEAVRPEHSWNADFPVSNWLLFNLQLHSDHHAHVARPFEALRSMPRVPQLPAGYPTMVLVALLPPLWFALMHPRLEAAAA
jgi:alkane 1-monooxygenase